VRHAAWGGLCVPAWAWLQMKRLLDPAFAVVIALMFVALEFLIARLRAGAPDAPRPRPEGEKRRPDGTKSKAEDGKRRPGETKRKPTAGTGS
jgi:hypothetical protein